MSSSAVGDGSVDDAPKKVSTDFDGITRVEAVDCNIVGHHPTRGLLLLTNSGLDSQPALSTDGRVAFARWVTNDCAAPDEPNVSCSELWLLVSKGSPTRLLDKGSPTPRGRSPWCDREAYLLQGRSHALHERLRVREGAGWFEREVTSGPWSGVAIVCGMPLQPAPDYGRKEECGVVRADASARRTLSVEQQVERRARREV
ncbi:MAG: hypothetical protein JNL79_11055, partial [Myxococcales bacterium]|nr:hypothetical protein [Myxococcales bacterium]